MDTLSSTSRRWFEQLRKLTEVSRVLTNISTSEEVLRLATDCAADLLEAESSLLMLSDEEGLLQVRAARGITTRDLDRFREPLDETLIRRLQGLLNVPTPEAFLGVPLVMGGAVIGLLAVVRRADDPPPEEEEWLLSAVADQAAVALERSRLVEEVRRARNERAHAVEGADEADHAKDRALATISHDLRSPLNAIDSYAELMEMEILGAISDRQREALGRIRMSGRHLLGVLENVLDMARLNAGAVRLETGAVKTDVVIEEAILMLGHTATAREQVLDVEPSPALVVKADPNRLRQVLVNLIGNAIKYTPPRGTIRVGVRHLENERGDFGVISVSDSGPGIPADKQLAIFQPYYRIVESEGEGTEGAGLGLAISRELARQMGGDIEVKSEPGQGCTFSLLVPLYEE